MESSSFVVAFAYARLFKLYGSSFAMSSNRSCSASGSAAANDREDSALKKSWPVWCATPEELMKVPFSATLLPLNTGQTRQSPGRGHQSGETYRECGCAPRGRCTILHIMSAQRASERSRQRRLPGTSVYIVASPWSSACVTPRKNVRLSVEFCPPTPPAPLSAPLRGAKRRREQETMREEVGVHKLVEVDAAPEPELVPEDAVPPGPPEIVPDPEGSAVPLGPPDIEPPGGPPVPFPPPGAPPPPPPAEALAMTKPL